MQHRLPCHSLVCHRAAGASCGKAAPAAQDSPGACRQTGRTGDGTATRAVLQPGTLRATAVRCGSPERPYCINGSRLPEPSWTMKGP